MTRRALRLATLGIAAYSLFLLATIPASLVADRVRTGTNAMVRLTEARGTLWNGSARAIISPAGSAPIAIDILTWNWRPARLFAGEIALAAHASAGDFVAEFQAARSFAGWELRGLAARADASRLAAFVPLVAPWQPRGAISVASPRLAWDGQALTGELAIEWRGATTALSEVRPLGTYKVEVKAAGAHARIAVTTLHGPLRIQGAGTLALPARVSFQGEARAESAQAAALEPLLALLGPKRADGANAIDWRAP